MSVEHIVAIVGRVNVGKSTLFNKISDDARSLAFDYPGVTRDVIKGSVAWDSTSFTVIDTGGVEFKKTQDSILMQVRQQALAIIKKTSVIILVCDGKVGVLQEDRDIAKFLHKMGKKVIVAVNKCDVKDVKDGLYQYETLGFSSVLPISASHSTGINDLLDAVVALLPEHVPKIKTDKKQSCNIVLLGKPNVGKSSLMNLLVKQERSIVADLPGTTREAITERISFYKEDLLVTDTAGVRKKRAVHEPLESLMVKSSLHAIDTADVVLLLVDGAEGKLSDQELKLAFYVFEQHKSLIILFNKQDLMEEYEQVTLDMSIEKYKHLLEKLETLSISCKTGKNVGRVLTLVQKVWKRNQQIFADDLLTDICKESLFKKPLYKKGNLLRLHYVKQVATSPVTLLLVVNDVPGFGPSQLAFLDRILRKKLALKSVPIRFIARKKG